MGGYVGGAEDIRRIRKYEKRRENQKQSLEDERAQQEATMEAAGLRQFGSGQAEVLEAAFKSETVGLVTRAEFVTKRTTLAERIQDEKQRRKRAAEDSATQEKDQRAAQKAKLALKAKLSFLEDGDDDAEGDASASPQRAGEDRPATVGKDPTIQTDFLPDKARSAAEQNMRDQLRTEWQLRQKIIKNEPLEITYSYWDGTGHRRKVVVRKGDTIADFLRAVRDQLSPDFRELRGVSATDLMYVKEDVILSHDLSFYDLIVRKARGKSGPLFHFDVHEDVRVQNDARIEKDESHAGKVVERHWYNRNKHIFPASRWAQFDPGVAYESYSIHGD